MAAGDRGYRRYHGADGLYVTAMSKIRVENALLPVDTLFARSGGAVQTAPRRRRFSKKTERPRGIWRFLNATIRRAARQARPNAMGVRTANVITHALYHGVTASARLPRPSFESTTPTERDVLGPYRGRAGRQKESPSARIVPRGASPGGDARARIRKGWPSKHWGQLVAIAVRKTQRHRR